MVGKNGWEEEGSEKIRIRVKFLAYNVLALILRGNSRVVSFKFDELLHFLLLVRVEKIFFQFVLR